MVRRFSAPDTVPHGGALGALSMSYADGFSIGNLLDFQVGGEAEAIQFLGQEDNAFRPSAIADFHLGSNTILEYRYSTTEPNTRASKGFDTAPADLTETAPRMTMVDGDPLLENAHHHEVSLSERMGDNKLQLAYYNDRVKDPALLGVGDINTYTGDILPDLYSGTFSYNGGELQAQGVRFVFQHRISNNFTATVDYAYGGVLELEQPGVSWTAVHDNLESGWRHSAALKLNGFVPRTHTKWIASYRWTSGQTLVPVDLFNASAGQTDPVLQPVHPPAAAALPRHARQHGSDHRRAQPAGAGLCAGGRTGRPDRVPGAVSAQRTRRVGVHVLNFESASRKSPPNGGLFVCRKS